MPASSAKIEKCQTTLLKRCLGLSKHSHHDQVLNALRLEPVQHSVNQNIINLYIRIFSTDSPARTFNRLLLSRFILTNTVPYGTLLHRVLTLDVYPIELVLTKKHRITPHQFPTDGFLSFRVSSLSKNERVQPIVDSRLC